MFNTPEVLVSAIKLTALPGIFVDESVTAVTYYHLVFDAHQVVFANGAPSESFYIGARARASVNAEAWAEIVALFPQVAAGAIAPAARVIPDNRMQKQLVGRHLRKEMAVLAA